MMMTMLLRGRLIAVPTVERALRFLAEEGVPPETLPVGRRIIAGNPPAVRAELEELVRNYGAEELSSSTSSMTMPPAAALTNWSPRHSA